MKYEIWVSDKYGHFERGVAYMDDGRTLQLKAWVNEGGFDADSLLISSEESFKDHRFPLRWYIGPDSMDFYAVGNDAPEEVLFHNDGSAGLRVNFDGFLPAKGNLVVHPKMTRVKNRKHRGHWSIICKARYQWSADGIAELCECENVVAPEDVPCYHCNNPIPNGSACMRLTAPDGDRYLLHDECFFRNAIPV